MQSARLPSGEREAALPSPRRIGGRAVGRAEEGRVARAAALAGLAEQHRAAVLRQVGHEAPVEPGKVPLGLVAGRERDEADPVQGMRQEQPSVAGHVGDRERSGAAEENPHAPGGRRGVQRAVAAHVGRREPDLRAVRRPREPHRARVERRQVRLLSREVDDRHGAAVVVGRRVVDERDPVAAGGEPRLRRSSPASRRSPCRSGTRADTSPATRRTMAMSLPSGGKSAYSTFSRISLGAPPPVAATRASVPTRVNAPEARALRLTATSPEGDTARTSAFFRPNGRASGPSVRPRKISVAPPSQAAE